MWNRRKQHCSSSHIFDFMLERLDEAGTELIDRHER